jgi:hypothetical protein
VKNANGIEKIVTGNFQAQDRRQGKGNNERRPNMVEPSAGTSETRGLRPEKIEVVLSDHNG